jgi:hypothetical protein
MFDIVLHPRPPKKTVCVQQIASQFRENASRNLPRIKTQKIEQKSTIHYDFLSSAVECHVEDVQHLDCFVRQHFVPQKMPLPERGSASVLRCAVEVPSETYHWFMTVSLRTFLTRHRVIRVSLCCY